MEASRGHADYRLLLYFFILLLFGLIMLSSATTAIGFNRFNDSTYFIKHQLLYGVVPGLILFFFFTKFDYHRLRSLLIPAFVLTVVILLLVFIPHIGASYGTFSHSWIDLGGFSVQPSELAKLGLIIFFSAFLANQGSKILYSNDGFVTALGFGFIPVFLIILQPDIGTAVILFAILITLLYLAGARLHHLGGLALFSIIGFILLILVSKNSMIRINTFLHPEMDPEYKGYQINQGYLALGTGGFFGLGYGNSRQKFHYLPQVQDDEIFAIIGEEMGFLFESGFVILLVLIAFRGFVIARHAPDMFGRLLVGGIITWFLVQSFINIDSVTGLIPFTGVPLPFVSAGGTALISAMAGVGIIINVSKQQVHI